MKTINDIFKYCNTNNIKMLSDYGADFWADYKSNYARYDALFRRKYLSFVYFLQDREETIQEVSNNFIADVYNHLLVNDKKYSELYRIHVIPDDEYSLTENYNIEEKMDRDTTSNNTNTYGSRSDSESETLGSRTDSGSETLGSRSDSGSETLGSRSDSGTNTIGAQSNSVTSKVAPYDSSTFANNTQEDTSLGNRSDSNSFTLGQQNNSNSSTIGQQDNSTSTTIGQQSNSNSFTKGEQLDELDNVGTEDYTLTRHGNIGVQTVTDMLEKHKKFWTVWEFYNFIFYEISKELLLVD